MVTSRHEPTYLTTGRLGTSPVGLAAAPGNSSPPLPFIPHSNAPSNWVGTSTLGAPARHPKYKSTALQHKQVANVYNHHRHPRAVATWYRRRYRARRRWWFASAPHTCRVISQLWSGRRRHAGVAGSVSCCCHHRCPWGVRVRVGRLPSKRAPEAHAWWQTYRR